MSDEQPRFQSRAPSMCPVVNTMVEQDWIKPSREHRVDIAQIREGISRLGISSTLKTLLVYGPLLANHKKDLLRNLGTLSFSLPHLRGGFFDHPAATDAMSLGHFAPAKFKIFGVAATIAGTPGRVGVEALAYVLVYNQAALLSRGHAASPRGFALSLLELCAMLDTFGEADDAGDLSISVHQLLRLYGSGELPDDETLPWQPRRVTGLRSVAALMGKVGARAMEIAQDLENLLEDFDFAEIGIDL
jgi:hypothetical protein